MSPLTLIVVLLVIMVILPNAEALYKMFYEFVMGKDYKPTEDLTKYSDIQLINLIRYNQSSYDGTHVHLERVFESYHDNEKLYIDLYNNRGYFMAGENTESILDMISLYKDVEVNWRKHVEHIHTNRDPTSVGIMRKWSKDINRLYKETERARELYYAYKERRKRNELKFNIQYEYMLKKCDRLKLASPTGHIFENNINELKTVYLNALSANDTQILTEVDNQLNKINDFLDNQLNTFKLPATKSQMEEWLQINERYLDSALSSYENQ